MSLTNQSVRIQTNKVRQTNNFSVVKWESGEKV